MRNVPQWPTFQFIALVSNTSGKVCFPSFCRMLVYVPKVIQWVGWVVCAHVLCIIPPLPKQAQAEQTSASSIERALPPRITAACVSAMLARLFCLLCFFCVELTLLAYILFRAVSIYSRDALALFEFESFGRL